MSDELKPCPFCGKRPKVVPSRPDLDGNAWGAVLCVNKRCAAQPKVKDGSNIADDRGSAAYKALAIRRWNRRGSQQQPQASCLPPAWMPIETAPKDGTEILAWREDCGVMMARYTCADSLRTMSDKERDELDETSLFQEDWFGGDSEQAGFRLEGSEVPTHWMHLPTEPQSGETEA